MNRVANDEIESGTLTSHRRRFLQFLASSPVLALAGFPACSVPEQGGQATVEDPALEGLIEAAEEALSVFDFRDIAEATLPPAHYGYLATGVDGDETLRANREGFKRFQLRVRRLIDVSKVDTSTEILGVPLDAPMMAAPVGSQKAFHPDGEVAVAGAARQAGLHQFLSTVTTSSVEEVNEALGRPVWYQLYPTTDWEVTKGLVKRASSAGCDVLVLTVDLQGGSNRETLGRWILKDDRDCTQCHGPEPDKAGAGQPIDWKIYTQRKPMFDGLDVSRVRDLVLPEMTWDFISRLRDLAPMRMIVKGIVTAEDADECVARGLDAIVVSNHGGRAENSGRATIECLPEVVGAVRKRVPVLVDSGFRRGTDVFKALALGADAVLIGRPYMWGLASFGQKGVAAVMNLLQKELEMVMRQAGTTAIARISAEHIQVSQG